MSNNFPRFFKYLLLAFLVVGFVFPSVTEAATFGYESVGGSYNHYSVEGVAGNKITSTSAEDGVSVQSITAHTAVTSGTDQFKGHITTLSGTTYTYITNGITPLSEDVSGDINNFDWHTATYSSQPTLAGSTTYGIGINFNSMAITWDSASANESYTNFSVNFTTPPSSFTGSDGEYNSNVINSVYATYTTSAGSSPTPQSIIWFE